MVYQASNVLLNWVPGLGDGREVAAGHHHAAQERAVRVVAPVEQVVVDDGERLGPAPEVDGEVGGEDRVLQYEYHTFELILGINTKGEDIIARNSL